MKHNPQKYRLIDAPNENFIDEAEIWDYINKTKSSAALVEEVLQKSLNKQRLSLEDVAILINARYPKSVGHILEAAKQLKNNIYGNRIVLFAPFYIGNHCSNDCAYCGFKKSNMDAERKTLNDLEIIKNISMLEDDGHKRIVAVFGEHRKYSPDYISETIRSIYKVRKGKGEIRRINLNAAPMDVEGFRKIKEAGIGTYQIFQETYHPEYYKKYHPSGSKSDYDYRLTAFDRAMQAGLDDVGIGALFGLYDWRFELLSLIRHTNHLEACFNVGPHTISVPRLQQASHYNIDSRYKVSDSEFTRLVAILRLAVPYAGLILTAREPKGIRKKLLEFGISQIDAGSNIEIGGYAEQHSKKQDVDKEQFLINDQRPLDKVMTELIDHNLLPSFCTACYRKGRTGEHFMEFSVPGFIKRFCTPNAILSLAEYLEENANSGMKKKGWLLIDKELRKIKELSQKADILKKLEQIKEGATDLHY